MASVVYFGTKDKQSWIKSPSTEMKADAVGWSSKTQLLNGRSFVRRSKASHREFNPSWFGELNGPTEDSLQTIKNYAEGLYGDGPYYFLDPFAAAQNALPPHWAAPMLNENDWPNLAPGIIPTFTKVAVANNYPIKYATYVATAAYQSTNKLTLIIPTGYKLAFGWHGPSAGASTGIRVVPYKRSDGTADTAINPTKITAGGTIRTNTNISGTTYSRVEIFIATAAAATLNITAMIAQIIPTADSVASGGFIAGKGVTALEFDQAPTIEYYSSGIGNGQVGMSANWTEV
jgi:hypothetical protein